MFAAVLLIVTATGCGQQSHPSCRRATVSIEPLRYFAECIGGSEWKFSTIVAGGFSPEEFQPLTRQMADVARAQCLFKIGRLGFETTWLPNAADNVPGLRVVDTSRGIADSAFDPHTWTSPSGARMICRNIAEALCTLDSASAPRYRARLRAALSSIDSLDAALGEILSDLPSRSFVIVHPALTRFAADYGLRQIAIEADGKEPTPASIRGLIAQARADGVRVIFVQQEFSEQSALVIAEQTGAEVVSINPLSYDWPSQMLHIAKALKYGKQ